MTLEAIRQELWAGEIPVCFSVDSEDLHSVLDRPEPCCVMIPR